MRTDKFTASVVCIGAEGDLFGEVVSAGIAAKALGLGGKRDIGRALVALVSHMRRTRPDVVVVWGYNAEILGRIAARFARVKHCVVWVHAAIRAERPNSLRDLALRALVPWTSSYFGVAESQRKFIVDELRCPPDKVRIIHNGVDPALFGIDSDPSPLSELGIEAGESVVGIVAALRSEKDHGTLLRAVAYLLDENFPTTVLIVGDGPTRPELEALCGELGIAHIVRFAGSRGDIATLLRAIDVFVLCSTTECFPISVLEAMASARPVVCTDVGGVREIVVEGVTGYLVPPREPKLLASRLKKVLSDTELAQDMGRAGRRRVESEFTLDASVAAAEQALEDVVVARRGAN
jgi:glycosyltransferase involved in cell wall biosynthesis